MAPRKNRILLAAIILTALFFRFQNLNWDSGFHLHPDERFLTMVAVAMKIPSSIAEYVNPSISPMNPGNIGYAFYVYGIFPVVLTKILAVLVNVDTYADVTLLGRFVTGLLDVGIVLLLFQSLRILEEEKIVSRNLKYWGSFCYAIMVLPIQYAHFFTTDTFLNFFMFGSFYLALRSYRKSALLPAISSAVFFGLAISSKVNAVLLLPLLLFLLFIRPLRKKRFLDAAYMFVIFVGILYATVRIASPYYFQSADPFDLTPNSAFVQNLMALKSFEGHDVAYPPALQWVNTVPVVFPVLNMSLFGLGVPLFILLCVGVAVAVRALYRNRGRSEWSILSVILAWVLLVFGYETIQFVKVMRYFLFLYPFFALFAGWGGESLTGLMPKRFRHLAVIGTVAVISIWPLIFSSIYFIRHTRVTASAWIYRNLPNNAVIATEYWDDALPVLMPDTNKTYRFEQLTVFDPDSAGKWNKIRAQLGRSDYYILSSNRGWGTLPSIPERFPESTKFYRDLFAGREGYTLIRSFYPAYYPCSFLNLPCPRILSNWFDESFTVYDHPTVFIFKRNETHP